MGCESRPDLPVGWPVAGRGKFQEVIRLALRRFEGFPFFEFLDAAFTVGSVGLMVALCMVLDQYQNVAGLAFGLRKTALH